MASGNGVDCLDHDCYTHPDPNDPTCGHTVCTRMVSKNVTSDGMEETIGSLHALPLGNGITIETGTTPSGWHPCLKQKTRCVIVAEDGAIYEATNSCHVEDATVCPRVTAGCPTGEGYDLCGPPKHAEAEAAAMVPAGNMGGTAYLYGHDWMCGPCQHALQAAGVSTFVITGGAA